MNINPVSAVKRKFPMKRLIIILVIAAVLVLAVTFVIMRRSAARAVTTAPRTDMVRRGEISTTVTGSGPVTSSSRNKLSAKSAGTVTAVYFKEGDRVKAGDLLVELDSSDAQDNVDKSRTSLEQMQETQKSNMDDLNSLKLTAPFDGQIIAISADVGAAKTKNDAILTLADTSLLKLSLSFTGAGIGDIKVGKDAAVYVQDFMDTVNGKVTYVSSRPYTTSSGGQLYSVDIEVENPGSLQEGMKASAEIETSAGTVSSVDAGSLQYKTKSAIKCAGGTISQVNVRQNQYVKKGELLVTLENKDITKTVEDTDQKIRDLEKQLESVQEQLDNYKICSPIDGVIVSQTVSVGDIVKAGDALSVVSDDKSMEFTIPVDELDIQKVKMGQEANITVDALHDTTLKPLAGKVTHIALEGTSTNGVTTYPVTVSVSQYDGLLAGMNANAEIFITRKTDVLYVPIEAIQRVAGKTYVMVKGDPQKIAEMKKDGTYIDLFGDTARSYSSGGSTGQNRNNNNRNTGNANRNSTGGGNNDSSGARAISNALSKYKDYYADAIPTPVEVGLNNETSIEIVSGLKEGDEIILPPMASSNSSAQGFRLPGGMNFGGAGGSTNSSTRRQQN